MNDYFIDPLGRGPKGPPPPPQPQLGIIRGGGAVVGANIGRGAMGATTMMAPIFPDAGFESGSSSGSGNPPIMQPQHLISSQHRTTTQQQIQAHHPPTLHQQPIQASAHNRHYYPNDDILPSPMQVYLSSSNTSNKTLSDGVARPTTHIRDEPPFHNEATIPSSSADHCRHYQENHPQHHQQYHSVDTTSYYHHPHQIEIEGADGQRHAERACHHLESSKQYSYHHQQQQQRHGYNHQMSTQSKPHPRPQSSKMLDPHCRLVSSDSETVFHRNHCHHHNQLDVNNNVADENDRGHRYNTSQHTSCAHCRITPPYCVGATSSRLCCGGGAVVGEDNRSCRHGQGYHQHQHPTCTNHSCHYYHDPRHPQDDSREYYDPSMDVRLRGRADICNQRQEFRNAPPPSPLPLSPLTIPSVVNTPVGADNRRVYRCPQFSTDATCSDGGGLHDVHASNGGAENYFPSPRYNDYDYPNGLGGKRRYHGYHPSPHASKMGSQENSQHSPTMVGYNHPKHPCSNNPPSMQGIYSTTIEYNDRIPQQRDDYNSIVTSTAYGPSPQQQHRHPPPPPPPPYTSRQQQCSQPYGTNRTSRLSIEIPHSPPHAANNRHPIHSENRNGPNGSAGTGRSRTPTRSISAPRTEQQQYHHHSSSTPFAEYEKNQSEARHQLLREISQATNMRNSALDGEDKQFWERQIDTLNQTFRKL
jgi:hypothetical protein